MKKKHYKTALTFLLLLCLIAGLAACRDQQGDIPDTDNVSTDTSAIAPDNSTDTADTSLPEESTTDSSAAHSGGSGTGGGSVLATSDYYKPNGLNSTNIGEIVKFYKAAAKRTGTLYCYQSMSLGSIDFTPKNGFQVGMLSTFRGIATAALKMNSTPRTDVPGNHQALEPGDLNSANAVVYGNYTVVTLNVKSQEDNQDVTDSGRGSVGHAVGTLGDINKALNAIPAVKIDYSSGSIVLRYENCRVVVRIDNKTGKIVTGSWSYTVDVSLTNVRVTMFGNEFSLSDTGGTVDFKVETID